MATIHYVTQTTLRLYEVPADAALDRFKPHGTELLYGEAFAVEHTKGDMALGRSLVDGYEGWVLTRGLKSAQAQDGAPKTMRACKLYAPIYAAPDVKGRVLGSIPFGGRALRDDTTDTQNGYVREVLSGGWVRLDHFDAEEEAADGHEHGDVPPTQKTVGKAISTAQIFMGCPYVYGGRSPAGIDCSALVQLAFAAHGAALPRDSGPQRVFLAKAGALCVDFDSLRIDASAESADHEPRALDIVFFPGHVGMMVNNTQILHATGHGMKVCIEDIVDVEQRYTAEAKAKGSSRGITALRRFVR